LSNEYRYGKDQLTSGRGSSRLMGIIDGWIMDGYLARGILGSKCLAYTENECTVRVRYGTIRRHDPDKMSSIYDRKFRIEYRHLARHLGRA